MFTILSPEASVNLMTDGECLIYKKINSKVRHIITHIIKKNLEAQKRHTLKAVYYRLDRASGLPVRDHLGKFMEELRQELKQEAK